MSDASNWSAASAFSARIESGLRRVRLQTSGNGAGASVARVLHALDPNGLIAVILRSGEPTGELAVWLTEHGRQNALKAVDGTVRLKDVA